MSAARATLADAIRAAIPMAAPELVNAFASIPRERFLPPGPWQVRDASGTHMTADANPDRVYIDASIAVDPGRDLYNGQPSTVARWFDAMAIHEGERVLHIGCGSGYYSAILADMVGAGGRVIAVDVDESLANTARENLQDWPWVEVLQGNGTNNLPSDIDVVVVHAGASHIRHEWLTCTRPRARILVPLTVEFAAMGPTLGKGLAFVFNRRDDGWGARALSFVAIYSLQSARLASLAATFGQAMQRGGWDGVTQLRIDDHAPEAACWCHWDGSCLSTK